LLLDKFRRGDLGHDPVRTITHWTGLTAITILFITLTVTPIRRLTGWNGVIRLRRPIGLFAFFYALLHVLTYAVFDRQLSLSGLGEDILERPWLTVGFTVFVLLAILAATSPQAMVRRLGRGWKTLPRLVYPAAALAVLHFVWSQKKDIRLPLIYAAILAGIFALRLLPARRKPVAGREVTG